MKQAPEEHVLRSLTVWRQFRMLTLFASLKKEWLLNLERTLNSWQRVESISNSTNAPYPIRNILFLISTNIL